MHTRPIDQALEALTACRQRVPYLRDLHRVGGREREALDKVLHAVAEAQDTLAGRPTPQGRQTGADRV